MSPKRFIVVLIGVLLTVGVFFAVNGCSPIVEKTAIQNIFVDVNGDGMTDLILTGEVILNNGSTNFPVQPTSNQP